jgi:hypothetical protein
MGPGRPRVPALLRGLGLRSRLWGREGGPLQKVLHLPLVPAVRPAQDRPWLPALLRWRPYRPSSLRSHHSNRPRIANDSGWTSRSLVTLEPCGPAAPGSSFGPRSPSGTLGSHRALGPCGPAGAAEPVAPSGPGEPSAPRQPGGPACPGSPFPPGRFPRRREALPLPPTRSASAFYSSPRAVVVASDAKKARRRDLVVRFPRSSISVNNDSRNSTRQATTFAIRPATDIISPCTRPAQGSRLRSASR